MIQGPDDRERVRRNALKMRAAGAPESEVLAYLQQEDAQERAAAGPSLAPPAQATESTRVAPRPEPSAPGMGIGDALTMGVKGATFGLADEGQGLQGAYRAAQQLKNPITAYKATRDAARANQDRIRQEHPTGSTVAELAGGLVPALLTMGGSAAASAPTVLGRVGQAAKGGAKFGALFGFGNAEGSAGQQALETAGGGVLGGVAGGVLGAGLEAGKGVVGATTRRLAKSETQMVPGDLRKAAQRSLASRDEQRGADLILRNLKNDEAPVTELQRRITAARTAGIDDVVIPDVAGTNTRGLLDLAASRQGPQKETIRQFNEARAGTMREKLADALHKLTGQPKQSAFATAEELVASRREAANALFEPVFAGNPVVRDAGLLKAIQQVEGASNRYGASAREIGRNFGQATHQAVRTATGTAEVPTLRYVHYLKESIDAEIGKELAGAGGGSGTRLASLMALKDRLRDAAIKESPDYGAALAKYAGDSAELNALKLGERMLHANVAPEALTRQVAKMTPGEQEMFRVGGMAATREFIEERASLAPSLTKAWWNSPKMQAKLRVLFDDPADFEQFLHATEVTRGKMLTQAAGAGSQTFPRQAANQELGEALTGGLGPEDAPIVGGIGVRFAREGMRRVLEGMKNRATQQATPFLTSSGGQLDDLMRVLAERQASLAQAGSRRLPAYVTTGGLAGQASGGVFRP